LRSEHIPIAATSSMPRGVLVVEQDITEAVTERERRERTLSQLIRSLVGVVDRRDPNAADHSMRVAEVARRIAREMGIEPLLVETAETAGRLMNLGKILVSEDLLTRTEGLSKEEIERVREGIQASADLLEGIEFDGPVVETLRQVQEMWDGSGGPAGREGGDIIVTARIVSVANTFVALTSPRAHRSASAWMRRSTSSWPGSARPSTAPWWWRSQPYREPRRPRGPRPPRPVPSLTRHRDRPGRGMTGATNATKQSPSPRPSPRHGEGSM
jgi:hypothetical protein